MAAAVGVIAVEMVAVVVSASATDALLSFVGREPFRGQTNPKVLYKDIASGQLWKA